ncbi:hypothetical protein PR001_g31716 [Phytophthora rubi]|uniref:Uncharacterized protein n=1 Tax=Phytophthora rubi TaxID=129364 RepID=A0A6A3GIH9_9STRA|nr:hypothetical protein PR001_g31716 [Phytophthora rubi]
MPRWRQRHNSKITPTQSTKHITNFDSQHNSSEL